MAEGWNLRWVDGKTISMELKKGLVKVGMGVGNGCRTVPGDAG